MSGKQIKTSLYLEVAMRIIPLLILCILLFGSINLSAIEMRFDETYLIESNKFEEDYFATAEKIEFSGETKDFYGFAEEIHFTGLAKLAIFTAGKHVNISGTAGNGIKAGGKSITLNGKTTGTSFLGGEKVTFETESETKGDTFVGARKVLVNGEITGDFYAGAGEVLIQNEIHGNVQVHTGKLMISDQGKIHGDLVYHSDYELSVEEAARVTGNITFEKNKEGGFHDTFADHDHDYGSLGFTIFFKFAFAVLGFLVLLFPATRVLEQSLTRKEVLTNSLWGLIPIFVYPSAFVISILLVITIPLAFAMLLGFIPILFLTKIIGITLIGGLIARSLDMNSNSRFMYFLIGIVLYSLLSLIPFIGFLLLAFVSSIGCGMLLSSLFQKKFA